MTREELERRVEGSEQQNPRLRLGSGGHVADGTRIRALPPVFRECKPAKFTDPGSAHLTDFSIPASASSRTMVFPAAFREFYAVPTYPV